MQAAEEQLRLLYETHDFFFSKDPQEKRGMLEQQAASVMSALEEAPEAETGEQRAQQLYIRGRAQDVYSEYSKAAEDALSRAVKLQPDNPAMLDALGHCLWKKPDWAAAQRCFLASNEAHENASALRHLSMLLRQVPAASDAQKLNNLRESLARAKQAVKLGVADPESWYNLGNAYVALYFGASRAAADLAAALQAYARAEANGGEHMPDLHFNR